MITTSELRTIRSTADWSNVPPEIYKKFTDFVEIREDNERRMQEDDARRAAAIPIQVPDFSGVQPGTLVERSDHALKENSWQKQQIGIITGIKILDDDLSVASFWPDVHWEGSIMSMIAHPLNVKLRDGTVLKMRTMNANQQTKPKLKTEEKSSVELMMVYAVPDSKPVSPR